MKLRDQDRRAQIRATKVGPGQIEFAQEVLDKAEARFGADVRVMRARVQAYQAVGDFPKALIAAERAVAPRRSWPPWRLYRSYRRCLACRLGSA